MYFNVYVEELFDSALLFEELFHMWYSDNCCRVKKSKSVVSSCLISVVGYTLLLFIGYEFLKRG
jgi:hypothetical protein